MNKRHKDEHFKESVYNHIGNGSVGMPLSKILQNDSENHLMDNHLTNAKTKSRKSALRSMEQSPDRASESSDSDSLKIRVFQTPIRDR